MLRLAHIHLRERVDIFRWSIKYDGQFTVSSMYQVLLDSKIIPHNSYLWKIKLPLRIKVFLWVLYREAILTKDTLVKINCHENEMCNFCSNKETIQHLFFDCTLAKFIWRAVYLVAGLPPPNNIRHMFRSWVCNMNKNDRHIFLVGVDVMLWAIWLQNTNIFFCADYFQGNTLDNNMGQFPKRREDEDTSSCMPYDRDIDNGDFHHGSWFINRLRY
jgi:hypothetical protein